MSTSSSIRASLDKQKSGLGKTRFAATQNPKTPANFQDSNSKIQDLTLATAWAAALRRTSKAQTRSAQRGTGLDALAWRLSQTSLVRQPLGPRRVLGPRRICYDGSGVRGDFYLLSSCSSVLLYEAHLLELVGRIVPPPACWQKVSQCESPKMSRYSIFP